MEQKAKTTTKVTLRVTNKLHTHESFLKFTIPDGKIYKMVSNCDDSTLFNKIIGLIIYLQNAIEWLADVVIQSRFLIPDEKIMLKKKPCEY